MACINFCFGFFYILITVNCLKLLTYRNDVAPQLLFSDRTTVFILDLETGNPSVIATGYKRVSHIDYHKEKNLIFWTRGNTIESIAYPSMTDSTAKVVITYEINLSGFTVDSIHDHLYWIHVGGIHRSNLNGYNRKSISRSYGADLQLDITNGWIFIMMRRKLEKCRFDGTEKQDFAVGLDLSSGTGLDPDEGRIYWTEPYESKRIRSALLNGSDIRTEYNVSLLNGFIHDLDISHSHIYFTIPEKGQLYKIPKNNESADISLLYTTTNIQGLKIYKNRLGPCNQYYIIRNEEKRSPEYVTDQSIDETFSDVLLNDNWYRIISKNGDEMPTYPPGLFHCGTVTPIWLNGSLPAIEEKNVTREACLQTFNDTCKEKIAINIVNCWNRFYVYQLPNTTTNSGYCFGCGPVSCADGLSSETGFFPGCSSLFPNETVLPFVKGVLIDGPVHNIPNYNSTPSLLSAFMCGFNKATENSYVYDIYWYINGDSVKVAKNVPYDNINGILRDSDWKNRYHMNMEVTCAVRIRTSVGSVPSPFFKSEVYKAGLYPEKYDYVVIEGEHVNIHFTSTVPVGCKGTHPDILSNCYQNVYIYLQKNDTDEPIKCYNNIVSRDIVFRTKFCGIRVGNLDWKEKKQLQVYGFSDGLYNSQDRSTVIKVSTTSLSTVNQIWNNLTIPDIKVIVRDKDYALRSRLCQSYNDPHIKTFDGRLYHYMDVGEYVIYRNDRGPYWVHALFTNCVSGWVGASCHCGIAMRSRQSLFVLRTCEKISRKEVYLLKHPLTEIRTCVDSDLSVKTTGNTYTVTLPIGTEIKFTVASYTSFITMISVKPSIYDVKDARGLCGVPSVTKDPSDDFHHREQGPIHDDQEFARSWKILPTTTPNEQLFLPSPHFLTEDSNTDIENDNQNSTDIENDNQNNTDIENDNQSSNFSTGMYCICEKQAEPNDEAFYTSQCSLSDSTEYCPSDTQSKPGNEIPSNPVVTSCTSNMQNSSRSHRTRRSVTDSDDIVLDHLPLEYDDDVNDTVPELDFRDQWTEEKANKTCTEHIKKSIPSEIPNVPGLSEYDYIQSCMLDIKITAGTTFIEDTIGAIQTKAIMELSRNQTLLKTKTDNNGSQTILDYVKSLLCPNNCSGNGTCVSGVCSCFDGYTGDDCLEQMSKPPSNIEIPANGLCGTRTRACRRTNVYGTFNSKTVWCRRRHFQIHKGSYEFTSVNEVVYADYRNLFMISVDLHSSRRKRSVSGNVMAEGFELSFSNDGQEFGNSGTVIIYDEQCFTCNATSKDCYPVIMCPEPPETVRDIVKFSSNTEYVIIGTSCAVLFLAIIVILVFLKIRNVKSRMKIRTMKEDNTPET